MFDPNTYLKILNAFNWSIEQADEVKAALTTAEASPEVEAEIKDVLTRLTDLCQNLEEQVTCGETSMSKMDVIEWNVAVKIGQSNQLKNSLTEQLANLLGLEWSNTTTCPAGSTNIGMKIS